MSGLSVGLLWVYRRSNSVSVKPCIHKFV